MSSPPGLAVPHTQNTAPVLEFHCLYTQDLRRKQKRWQDGRLKFHTFNKRVMVYDERSNFVGDAHWREDSEFDEGEELQLERGGFLVEVGECVGKRDQDLSELVDKRVKERVERAAAKGAITSSAGPRASLPRPQLSTPSGAQCLRPKPLNAVIGTPTGHYGRAMVSILSPFEQKHINDQHESGNGRPAKRQKHNDTPSKSGYAQNLMGATLALGSTKPINSQAIRYEPLRASISRPQSMTIDLTHEEDGDGMRHGAAQEGRHPRKVPPKAQMRNSDKSKSGYASSLTGASLTLSAPQTSAKGMDIPTKKPARPNREGHSNTSISQNSLTEPDQVSRIADTGTSRLRKTNGVKAADMLSLQQPPFPPPISKPPILESVQRPAASGKNKTTQGSLAARLIAEQPVTTLRIKSRPPRRMMMLMELPRPQPPALKASSDSGITISNLSSDQQLEDCEEDCERSPTQAPDPSDPFYQEQEEPLDIPSESNQPGLAANHGSPTVFNSGNDHHIIDSVLSRRKTPAETVTSVHSATSEIGQIPKEPVTISKVDGQGNMVAALSDSLKYPEHKVTDRDPFTPLRSSTNTSAQLNIERGKPNRLTNAQKTVTSTQRDVSTEEIARQIQPLATGSHSIELEKPERPIVLHGNEILFVDRNNSGGAISTHLPQPAPENNAVTDIDTSKPSFGPGNTEPAGQPTATGPDLGVNRPGGSISTVFAPAKPNNGPRDSSSVLLPTYAELGQNMDASVTRVDDRAPTQSRAHTEKQSEPIPNRTFSPPKKIGTVSGGMAIKPPIQASLGTSINSTSDSGRIVNTAGDVIAPTPKARLVNAASRGSLAKVIASNMIKMRIPEANDIGSGPPPPRSAARAETAPLQGNTGKGGPVKETETRGPWSRESFDLFGAWRPPEMNSDTHLKAIMN